MGQRTRSAVAVWAALALAPACIHAVPPAPTAGYGAPYKGTGAPIYAKDSRGDWDVSEGKAKITSEQALEATGDPEYEARRQIAKEYNARLYVEGQEHRRRGHLMMKVGAGAAVVGLVLGLFVPNALQAEDAMGATDAMPESRRYRSGFASTAASGACILLFVGGVGSVAYGYLGGRRAPPYHVWRTPGPLNRPAYLHQLTEPYNEKLGAPTMPDEDDGGTPVRGPMARPPKPAPPQAPAPHVPERPPPRTATGGKLRMRGGVQ